MEACDRRRGGMKAECVRFGNDRRVGIQCEICCARFFGPSPRFFAAFFQPPAKEERGHCYEYTDIGTSLAKCY